MEKQVIFREYHSQEARDHNNIQKYAQAAVDHVVYDAVTQSRRYAGFAVTKTGQAEITVAKGRMYSNDGAIYGRESALVQSMLGYLAAASQRIVSVSVYGGIVETDTETRDKLINEETADTTPVAVDTTRFRQATLTLTQGAESADPQPPALPVEHVEIARVLLDATQVVSITMMVANEVPSAERLDSRTDDLEAWKEQIGPRVSGLGADLADLANRVGAGAERHSMISIKRDLARLKETVQLPSTAVDYGADFYLIQDDGDDYNDTLSLGYAARVEEGIRFPDANADEFEIALFSSLDPNASIQNGILLPKYTEAVKLANESYHAPLGMAQYGFQNHDVKVGYMSRSRLRYGGGRAVCSNGAMWDVPGNGVPAAFSLYEFETQQIITTQLLDANPSHFVYRQDGYWFDTWKEPFLYTETTDHAIIGAEIAQTFPVTNDMWATAVSVYIVAKGGAENIHMALCEVTNGQPDKSKTVAYAVLDEGDIVAGWNKIAIPPTFLAKGRRYGIVLVSNADHQVGISSGQTFLDGTFFYSTDGAYYLGDLTKDLNFRIYGAEFAAPQVTLEFETINLDGGFRDIDILAHMWVPDSCQLIFEVRPGGAGDWLQLTEENLDALSGAPVLAQFRGRFVGTRDMMPALRLTDSRVKVSRPATAAKHVSSEITMGTPSDTLTFEMILEGFDDTPHDHDLMIKPNGAAIETADTVTTTLLDAAAKRYRRTYEFTIAGGPITTFAIIQDMATNSAANLFHVAEQFWYSN